MTDEPDDRAERALGEALSRAADRFDPAPLEVPRRRRTWPALVAAAAAVVLVAGLVTVARAGGDDDQHGPVVPVASGSVTPAVPLTGDVRRVTYHDVEITVPSSWGDALSLLDEVCASQVHDSPPYVGIDVYSSVTPAIYCTRENDAPNGFPWEQVQYWSPHVDFVDRDHYGGVQRDGVRTYEGWTLTTRTVGSITVQVLTDASTDDLAGPIVASAHRVEQDSAGCPTTSPIQSDLALRPTPLGIDTVRTVTSIAVCQYEGGDGPGLLGSRVVRGDDARAILAALKAAPVVGADEPGCRNAFGLPQLLVLRLRDGDQPRGEVYLRAGRSCARSNGTDDGAERRVLTRASCQPLWGGRVVYAPDVSTSDRECGEKHDQATLPVDPSSPTTS